MSIYDRLGFLANFVVKGKILMQDIWISEIGWDDQLPSCLMDKWNRWLSKLKTINEFSIPRAYHLNLHNNDVKNRQLHIFCDASKRAFAAVAYMRIESEETVIVSFIMARTRVTPTKQKQTIPKSELQAAIMGSRLATTMKDLHNIKFDSIVYWSDSTTVIKWIRSETRKFDVFTGNRIGEILDTTEVNSLRWLPSEENVADEATRDSDECDFSPTSRWLNGPAFMYKSENEWPQESLADIKEENAEMETKKHFTAAATLDVTNEPLDIKNYSSWLRIIRVTAWMIKFINKCRKKDVKSYIEVNEMKEAQLIWWRVSQKDSFHVEIEDLTNERDISKSSRLKKLSPFLDEEGILRMKNRLNYADGFSAYFKCPIILDSRHPYTKLLINQHHLWAKHQGQESVVNEIQQKYCIIGLKNAVRKCWYLCQICKNERSSPCNPEMEPVPNCRLNAFAQPFTSTVIDFFGPMEVTIGRRHEKRYGVIFTCMTTRAFHLEPSNNLSTDSTIMAIRRFIARRGQPKEIISDNATNFHGSNNELKNSIKEFNNDQIADNLSQQEIAWTFNPPGSPHMGGCWERLIRSVKKALKVILNERSPKEETLHTVMTEVEELLNSRPLTNVPVDPLDQEVLTPNHFLLGKANSNNLPGLFDDSDLYLRKQWKTAQQLTNLFWKRWMREYVPTLRKKSNWHDKIKRIKVGDVVLITDENSTRGVWPKGIIEALFPGKDGEIRVVDVKIATGTYRRPVNKLCILDVIKEDNSSQRVIQGEEMLP